MNKISLFFNKFNFTFKFRIFSSIILFFIFTYLGYNYVVLNPNTYAISLIIYTALFILLFILEYKKNNLIFNFKSFLGSIGIILSSIIFIEILFGNLTDWMTFGIYFILFLISQLILTIMYLILYKLQQKKDKNKQ